MNRFGTLYIIRNTVNSRVYIGKTYQTLEERWNEHVRAALNNGTTKLYFAMRDIGIHNFYIERLGTYEAGELENKETEYIMMYDSVNNGYNSTNGGEGQYILDSKYVTKVLNDLRQNTSLADIASKWGVQVTFLRQLMKMYDVQHKTDNNPDKQIKAIVSFNKENKEFKEFNSMAEAYRHMLNTYSQYLKEGHFYYQVKYAANTGRIAFGHFWFYKNYLNNVNEIQLMRYKNFGTKTYLDGASYRGKRVYIMQADNRYSDDDRKSVKQSCNAISTIKKDNLSKVDIYVDGKLRCKAVTKGVVLSNEIDSLISIADTDKYKDVNTLQKLYKNFQANTIAKVAGVQYNTINKYLKRYNLK